MLKTHMSAMLGREEDPDPFAMQIACKVIQRRAQLLAQPIRVRRRLAEAARDYAFHARQSIEARGLTSPFAAEPDETATPAEILIETEPHLLLGQRILKPEVGMEVRIFCLRPRSAPPPAATDSDAWLDGAQAFMELVQHPDGRWQVLHVAVDPAVRRHGVATRLYDCVEQVIDGKLTPSGWLSDDAYRFWLNRLHWTRDAYRQIDGFNTLWLSAKALLLLSAIERVKLDEIKKKMN